MPSKMAVPAPTAVIKKTGGGARQGTAWRSRNPLLRLAGVSTAHPSVCLTLILAVTLLLATRLPKLELRTDGAALHPINDPTVGWTTHDRQTFGDPEEVILLISSRPGGPRVATASGLRFLSRVHQELAALPGIQTEGVRSPVTIIDPAKSNLGALVGFLDKLPAAPEELASVLVRMRAAPLTDGLFLAPDGTAAAFYAPLAAGASRRDLIGQLESWLASHGEAPFQIRLTGPLIAEALLGEKILADLIRLVPIMILVVAILLLACLRTWGGWWVAMSKTLIVLLWTGGLMAVFSVPVTLVMTILPVLVLALAVTDEVHVIARFQSRLREASRKGRSLTHREVEREIRLTLRELWRPVAYTSLSTALGFLSFLSASIIPMRHFGAIAAVGILIAMFMTFTLTPALTVLLPRSWFSRRLRFWPGPRLRMAPALKLHRRPFSIVCLLLLLGGGLPGFWRLSVQDSWIDNFDPDEPLVQAEKMFNQTFWGTYRFDVVFTGPPGLFHGPDGAALIRAASRFAASAPHAAGLITYLTPLDTVAELLGMAFEGESLPGEAFTAVFQLAAEYAADIGLHRLVTPGGDAARIIIIVNNPDYARTRDLTEYIQGELGALAKGADVPFHVSGDLPLAAATVGAVVSNQLSSIAWALAGVGIFLFTINRNPLLTLIQLLPSAAAAWFILSGMGYADLPLGVATSMFTALTIGIGVDLALHVTCTYERLCLQGHEKKAAVHTALDMTAAGRRWSTLVLALGFLVLTASAFAPNHNLGILLSAAMWASYLTTYLVVTGLLVDTKRRSTATLRNAR